MGEPPLVVPPHPSKYPRHEGPKGSVLGGTCNVTRCDRRPARFFNIATRGYYCESCANAINWGRKRDMLCIAVDHDLTHAEMDALQAR